MSALLGLLPSWLTDLSAAAWFSVGFGGVVYSVMPKAPCGWLVRIAAVGALAYACYLSGFAAAQSQCEADKYKTQVRTLEAQKTALEERINREAAADRADAARAAADRSADAANQDNINATPKDDRR